MGTATWTGTGASLSMTYGTKPRSVFDAKTARHDIPGKAGDQGEVLKRHSEMIYLVGVAKGSTEFSNFRTQMAILESITDAVFSYTHAGTSAYSNVNVHVLHGEIELRAAPAVFLADWSVEMMVRE